MDGFEMSETSQPIHDKEGILMDIGSPRMVGLAAPAHTILWLATHYYPLPGLVGVVLWTTPTRPGRG